MEISCQQAGLMRGLGRRQRCLSFQLARRGVLLVGARLGFHDLGDSLSNPDLKRQFFLLRLLGRPDPASRCMGIGEVQRGLGFGFLDLGYRTRLLDLLGLLGLRRWVPRCALSISSRILSLSFRFGAAA
jgi:hypothetical protein